MNFHMKRDTTDSDAVVLPRPPAVVADADGAAHAIQEPGLRRAGRTAFADDEDA